MVYERRRLCCNWSKSSSVSFPSFDALQACAGSQSGQEAIAHAASISTGGAPVVLVVIDDLAG